MVERIISRSVVASAAMPTITRREALAGAAAFAMAPQTSPAPQGKVVTKGRLRQSVCRWCYAKIPLPEFFSAVAGMGLTAVDLLGEKDWPIAREHGLICSMGSGFGGSIADGLNVKANHEKILAGLTRGIPLAAAQKVPNLITFFGNRRGMGDAEASANCVEGLNKIKRTAEEHGVTICLELLNSKVDHKDYQGDHSAFGVEHRQGGRTRRGSSCSTTSTTCRSWRGTSSAPSATTASTSRTSTPAACPGATSWTTRRRSTGARSRRAIADTGFQGYFAHEFIPVRDPLTSLREAVVLCDV